MISSIFFWRKIFRAYKKKKKSQPKTKQTKTKQTKKPKQTIHKQKPKKPHQKCKEKDDSYIKVT